MSKFFRIVAVIIIILSVLVFLGSLSSIEEGELIMLLFASFSGIVSGLLLHTVGDLLDRVDYLESKLGTYLTVQSEDKLPQVKCAKCGKEYDMDYPKCPYCGATTDFTK
jgi:hypothetical protein